MCIRREAYFQAAVSDLRSLIKYIKSVCVLDPCVPDTEICNTMSKDYLIYKKSFGVIIVQDLLNLYLDNSDIVMLIDMRMNLKYSDIYKIPDDNNYCDTSENPVNISANKSTKLSEIPNQNSFNKVNVLLIKS